MDMSLIEKDHTFTCNLFYISLNIMKILLHFKITNRISVHKF